MNATARTGPDVQIAIIGAGFAGLGMAIRLLGSGRRDFVVLERADEVGGTWRENTYPGCACDVPSHLYAFSFAPNPRWTRAYAPQPEIQDYLKRCADQFGVRPYVRLGTAVVRAAFDEAAGLWRLEIAGGERLSCRFLITAIGGLARPALPDIPGRASFAGPAFHTQAWDHEVDLRGRRVAVVGTGASAIQVVPQLAPRVGRLLVFQRTPPWILPKPDRAISALERRLFTRLPIAQRLVRSLVYWHLEWRAVAFTRWPAILRMAQRQAMRHLARQVADPALREKLTPDYTLGCKRVLMADDYYPVFASPHMDLVTDGIREVVPEGLVTDDGRLHTVDCIVWGTGFRATDPIPRGVLFGRGGLDLVDAWKDGAEAYKGTVVAGFPNLFILTGPNTGLGHSSMVFMIESQVRYVLSALRVFEGHPRPWVEVRPEVQARYNADLQSRMGRTVWSLGGCRSWYVDPRSGRNTTLWPGFTFAFRWQTRRCDPADFVAAPDPSA